MDRVPAAFVPFSVNMWKETDGCLLLFFLVSHFVPLFPSAVCPAIYHPAFWEKIPHLNSKGGIFT